VRLRFNRFVQDDINGICAYYDSECLGLSDEFFAEFEATLERIRSNPAYWPPLAEGSNKRKATMKRFPYVIVFRQVSGDLVRVFVVKHQKRSEQFGSRRQ